MSDYEAKRADAMQVELGRTTRKLVEANLTLERLRAQVREFRQKCDPGEEHVLVTPDELANAVSDRDTEREAMEAHFDRAQRYREALERIIIVEDRGAAWNIARQALQEQSE